MRNKFVVLLFCLFSVIFSVSTPSSAAEFYKWVDAQGNMHISDKKPPTVKTKETGVDVVHFTFKGVPVGPEMKKENLAKLRDVQPDKDRSDSFQQLDLDKKWQFSNRGSGSLETGNQSLYITANARTNLHKSVFTAPIAYQSLEGVGDFSFQVSIDYVGKDEENSSGITLFSENRSKWMSFNFTPKGEVGWKLEDGSGESKPFGDPYITLKLFYTDGTYFFYYVKDGEWVLLHEEKGDPYNYIALFAFSWSSQDVTAGFTNVVFTVPGKQNDEKTN